MIVISVSNLKGGVAKTTVVSSLCWLLAKDGYSVLAIDMDPQADLSKRLGLTEEQREEKNIFEALVGTVKDVPLSDVIYNVGPYDLVPSDKSMIQYESRSDLFSRETRLKFKLDDDNIREKYDVIVIDTPPYLGLISICALTASDRVLIPVDMDDASIMGCVQLNETINTIKRWYNPGISVAGVFRARVKSNTNAAKDSNEQLTDICNRLQFKQFETFIRDSAKVAESHSFRKSIYEYAPSCISAVDYKKFYNEAKEVLLK